MGRGLNLHSVTVRLCRCCAGLMSRLGTKSFDSGAFGVRLSILLRSDAVWVRD